MSTIRYQYIVAITAYMVREFVLSDSWEKERKAAALEKWFDESILYNRMPENYRVVLFELPENVCEEMVLYTARGIVFSEGWKHDRSLCVESLTAKVVFHSA